MWPRCNVTSWCALCSINVKHAYPKYSWNSVIIHPRSFTNGPHTRYAKLLLAHAPGIPVTFCPPPRKPLVSDPGVAVQNYPPLILTPGGKNGLAHSYPRVKNGLGHSYPLQPILTPWCKLAQFIYFLTLQYWFYFQLKVDYIFIIVVA